MPEQKVTLGKASAPAECRSKRLPPAKPLPRLNAEAEGYLLLQSLCPGCMPEQKHTSMAKASAPAECRSKRLPPWAKPLPRLNAGAKGYLLGQSLCPG